jgi:hypothetical protein
MSTYQHTRRSASPKKGINAAAWFAASSFHSSALEAPKPVTPKPRLQPVEHWDGEKWITLYAEVK